MTAVAPIPSGLGRIIPRDATSLAWPTAVAAVFLLQAVLVLTHEPWMDEWQALQIALASPNLSALFANLHYEGHPPLWYLILRAVALVVPAAGVLACVQLVIALAMQGLVLFRLTLSRPERIAVALSYTVLIEMGSLSRSMSLGALILVAAFTARRRWAIWLAIAALPMADFLFGLLSLVAIALTVRAGRFWWPGALLWLVSSLLAAWSILPAADMVPALVPPGAFEAMVRASLSLSPQLVPLHMAEGSLRWGGVFPTIWAIALGPVFVLLGARMLRHARLEQLLFLAFAIAAILTSVLLYRLGTRHFALAALLLMLLRASAEDREAGADRLGTILWRGWVALGMAGGLLGACLSLVQPFDSGRKAAQTIAALGLDRQEIAAWPEASVQGVGVLLGREFTSLTKGCTESFRRWNDPAPIADLETLDTMLDRHARKVGHFFLISEFKMAKHRFHVPIRRIARVRAGYDGYNYHLYEIAWDRPRTAPLPPRCAPDRLPRSRWWGGQPL